MKTLLVAINAKYEHEGLAVWYLKAACQNKNIPTEVLQFSINDSQQRIWSSILEKQPDVVAFSCYIWNCELTTRIISDLKKANPDCVIIVGGPEVSYEGSDGSFKAIGADYIIKGEGEELLPQILDKLNKGEKTGVDDILTTNGDKHPVEYISPFLPEYLSRIKDRIAYIESSRGCPYRCSYCLSSESQSFTLFPLDKIKDDIEALVASKAKFIKFVDRSFNVNEKHSLGIWRFIRKFENHDITFHFEINPDRLTKEQLTELISMPVGLIQLEAGIQSTNQNTLKAVSRVMNVDRAFENLRMLLKNGNIHIHTDLIAGLPCENLNSFKQSFNKTYEVKAHHLQLGFLKILHGTRMRKEAQEHGYKYRDYPPYEVIENKYLGHNDILILKRVEEVLDRTYNSGRFSLTLDYLVEFFSSPFDMYEDFAAYLEKKEVLYQPISAVRLFEFLRRFGHETEGVNKFKLDTMIALDYACSIKNTVLPDFLSDSDVEMLDARATVEPMLADGWKKEYRKRFMVILGSIPHKKMEDSCELTNRILVDMVKVNAVTGRVEPILI